jgi:transcriptional regulator with XRE-family HTH domain
MPDRSPFVAAFQAVRTAMGLSQERVAQLHGVSTRTVERWSLGETTPSLRDRTKLLHTFRDAPRPVLEALARASGTTLAAAATPVGPASAERPALSARQRVDLVVCAVADATDTSPKTARALVRTAFRAAHGAGIAVEDVLRELGR